MIAVPVRLRYCLLLASFLYACILPLAAAPAGAQAGGEAIAQGFAVQGTASDFVGGALVSIAEDDARTVQLATRDTARRLVGVVSVRPLVALASEDAEVEVATSGTVQVLVSDINGSVRAGDKVTASPIEGVGMLATGGDQVVGTAQSNFDAKTATTQEVADSTGKKHTVRLGRVSLQVGISFYQAPSSGFIPPFVQGLANSIAGRPVSFVRILTCSLLLLLAVVSSAVLLYAAVRSGLISLGRNPMAAGAIRRGLLQVGIAIVMILGLTLMASYLILTV